MSKVMRVPGGCPYCVGFEDAMRKPKAERAVIEAAVAALSDLRGHVTRHFELFGTSNPYYKFPLRDLLEAIEALQEARDE